MMNTAVLLSIAFIYSSFVPNKYMSSEQLHKYKQCKIDKETFQEEIPSKVKKGSHSFYCIFF